MKIFISILFVVIPAVAAAQNFQGMTEADLQNMMMQAQKMQECMEKVNQAELDALEQRSEEFEAEIQELCEKGKRDKAQKKAIAFGKEMADNPAIKQMKKCGEMTQGMFPAGQMPMSSPPDYDVTDGGHVCDEEM